MNLPPDAALLLLTLGVLLIYAELNRPGWVVPGAAGLLATLLGAGALWRERPAPVALLLCGTAVLLLALDLQRPTHVLVSVAATLALVMGFCLLGGRQLLHTATALFCGVVLGAATAVLTRIARRARTNKRSARTSERLD
jgi:membrane-bound serine protease (ClpP class)